MTTVDENMSVRTSPDTAAVARDAVRKLLSRHRPPVSDLPLTDALLITSELTTNALRHAGGVTAFGCVVRENRLEITVEDASDVLPAARPPDDPSVPGGHGWPMVCRLACEVTVGALPGGGKRVRALVPLR
ncbi:ATP-binding protein [Streptomyces sp. ME19-01-6]|uniref:ATP-binding protein n=1 Tax=Streptomyces sp. ME19-01-6 TaxID=3028686 RepID=UPI0029AF8E70|nr:ATP-binding protein [Streptomyces sp. ME19-01-6]MDX3231971.1 ATP-binding protein [Streptomyces sp. ME19-01-6]